MALLGMRTGQRSVPQFMQAAVRTEMISDCLCARPPSRAKAPRKGAQVPQNDDFVLAVCPAPIVTLNSSGEAPRFLSVW